MNRDAHVAARPSPTDTIRTALGGAMVGAWGRENALRALAELEAEIERLRTRGGIARSLIPVAQVEKFHRRCKELGV